MSIITFLGSRSDMVENILCCLLIMLQRMRAATKTPTVIGHGPLDLLAAWTFSTLARKSESRPRSTSETLYWATTFNAGLTNQSNDPNQGPSWLFKITMRNQFINRRYWMGLYSHTDDIMISSCGLERACVLWVRWWWATWELRSARIGETILQ